MTSRRKNSHASSMSDFDYFFLSEIYEGLEAGAFLEQKHVSQEKLSRPVE